MLLIQLKIAWRNLTNNWFYTTINVLGLSLGMAIALVIALWINDELTYNMSFKNYNCTAQIIQSQKLNGVYSSDPSIPLPLEKVLKEEYNDYFDFVVISSWNNQHYLKYSDVSITADGNYMQEDAPKMLTLNITDGILNGLEDTHSIMLSESIAKSLFGNESAVNKIVRLDAETDLKVTAVYADIPFNTGFHDLEFILPWKLNLLKAWIKNSVNEWHNNSFQMFVQISETTNFEIVENVIRNVKNTATNNEYDLEPKLHLSKMKDWKLRDNFVNGKQQGGLIDVVWLFGAIGIFIVLLATINYINLSTARSEKRAREVGVKKAIGAHRSHLIQQFLSESFIIVLFAYFIALCIVFCSFDAFNRLSDKHIIFPWNTVLFWVSSIIIILTTSFISGSYPALYLSSFKPAQVLKGTFVKGKFSELPRKFLVIFQFVVSAILIVVTIIIKQQLDYTKNRGVGYDRNGLLSIDVDKAPFRGKFELMRSAFLESDAVSEISASTSPVTAIFNNRSFFNWEGKSNEFLPDFAWVGVSSGYLKSLKMNLIEGRDFSRDLASDSNAVILNKTAVNYMGLKDPIGKYIRHNNKKKKPMKIIGVVEDIVMDSPYMPVKQTLYAFDKNGDHNYYNLRLNPDHSVKENLNTIERVYKKHFPDLPFEYEFVDQQYAQKFKQEEQITNLFSVFTFLAIFISCLGLFGLTSFIAEQRTKEIGIRKSIGASVLQIWQMLIKDFFILILIACGVAIPIAYLLAKRLLSHFEYRIDISMWPFQLGIGIAIVLSILTVSYHSIKAARANPIKSLKTE